MKASCYFDGGSRGNPGTAGCAIVMRVDTAPNVAIERTKLLDDPETNNVAEYEGLLLGMRTALAHGVTDIQMISDSKLVVEQVLGAWKVNNPRLMILCAEAQEMGKQFDHAELLHVGRADNADADKLVTDLLDEITGEKRQK